MLVERDDEQTQLYFGTTRKSCYDVRTLHFSLSPHIRTCLTNVHGFSDNDTTGFFKKSKKAVFDLVNINLDDFKYLNQLSYDNLTSDEVAAIGKKLIISLYKGKLKVTTLPLDRLR